MGILLALLSHFPYFEILAKFDLTSDILFYIFLPILLFESAYNINYRVLLKNIRAISTLAVSSLIFSAILIAIGFYGLLGVFNIHIPFIVTLLFGALISATDTAAALAIFKNLWIPDRLQIIFEWESLFNDGTAIALFMIILGITESYSITPIPTHTNIALHSMEMLKPIFWEFYTYISWAFMMLSMIFMGILVGVVVWIIFSRLIQKIQNDTYLEITFSLIMAHATFLIWELCNHIFIPTSGVIATVTAAMVLGNYWRTKITPRVEEMMNTYWGLFTFVSNSMIFLLVGMLIVEMKVDWKPLSGVIIGTFIITLLARAIAVYILIPLLNISKKEQKIPKSWQHVLAWWALRGWVAIMLLYMIPGDLYIEGWPYQNYSIRDFLTSITVGVVTCSVFINTLMIAPIIKKFWVDTLTDTEELQIIETKLLIVSSILGRMRRITADKYVDEIEAKNILAKYQSSFEVEQKALEDFKAHHGQDFWKLVSRVTIRYALATEKSALLDLYKYNQIPEKVFKNIMTRLRTQIALIDAGEYRIEVIKNATPTNTFVEYISKYILDSIEPSIPELHRQYYEARAYHIITEKALDALHKLQSVTIFSDRKEFSDVLAMYQEFEETAKSRRYTLRTTQYQELRPIIKKLTEVTLWGYRDDEILYKGIIKKWILPEKIVNKIGASLHKDFWDYAHQFE